MEVKFPLTAPEKHQIPENFNITEYLENFSKSFDCEKVKNPVEKNGSRFIWLYQF